jgi:hypothetical protein
VTAIVYYQLGLFTAESGQLLWVFFPCIAIGVPLGSYAIRRLDAETFRQICMSFDAWVVGFGFSRVLIEVALVESPWAYGVLILTLLIDGFLLYIFSERERHQHTCKKRWLRRLLRQARITARSSLMTEPPHNPQATLNPFLGYVIAGIAVAMFVFEVLPSMRLQ